MYDASAFVCGPDFTILKLVFLNIFILLNVYICNKFSPVKRVLLFWIINLLLVFSAQAADSLQVLFIGNSMTYYNDMPYMFRSIAIDRHKPVSVRMYAPGGSGFVNHVADANVWALFAGNHWDAVILQPGTGESAGATATVDQTIDRGRQMLDSIYHYSPCARVFLYEIPYGVPSASAYNNYFMVQTMIRDSVGKMADALQVQMIPAGECARAYYAQYPNLLLHNSYNDIHPSAYGSLLIAAASYNALFQDSLSGSVYTAGLVADTVARFRHIADTLVLGQLSNWRINMYNLHAAFSYTASGLSVSFTNNAVNSNQILWDFGDGQSSAVPNPVHAYGGPGTYTVKLTAFGDDGCTDHAERVLTLSSSSALADAGIINNNLNVYPNPLEQQCIIHQDEVMCTRYVLYNYLGQCINTGTIRTKEHRLDLSGLPAGMYQLHLSGDRAVGRVLSLVKTL